jgi:hypothetical protein
MRLKYILKILRFSGRHALAFGNVNCGHEFNVLAEGFCFLSPSKVANNKWADDCNTVNDARRLLLLVEECVCYLHNNNTTLAFNKVEHDVSLQ